MARFRSPPALAGCRSQSDDSFPDERASVRIDWAGFGCCCLTPSLLQQFWEANDWRVFVCDVRVMPITSQVPRPNAGSLSREHLVFDTDGSRRRRRQRTLEPKRDADRGLF